MTVLTRTLEVSTKGHTDVVDLSERLAALIADSGLSAGLAGLFVPGSTAGLSTIEYEPGAVRDIGEVLESLAPEGRDWHHHQTWGDDNGSAHVRSCLVGPSMTVPFSEGRPILGTWQQVVLLDFDTRPRSRKIVVQLLGE